MQKQKICHSAVCWSLPLGAEQQNIHHQGLANWHHSWGFLFTNVVNLPWQTEQAALLENKEITFVRVKYCSVVKWNLYATRKLALYFPRPREDFWNLSFHVVVMNDLHILCLSVRCLLFLNSLSHDQSQNLNKGDDVLVGSYFHVPGLGTISWFARFNFYSIYFP